MNVPPEHAVLAKVGELTRLALGTYAFNPDRIEEDTNGERRIHQGGYGDRQLFELVQNAADEMIAPDHRGGTIQVVLTSEALYCANEGAPITPEGADTILRMGVSRKRGGQIGRFGVGVKSVLSVTQTPQFFGRSGSFGFDADWSSAEILDAVNGGRRERGLPALSTVGGTPVLRLARPLDMQAERTADPILHELLQWATTVVRLPLLRGADLRLGHDIQQVSKARPDQPGVDFPPQFQLFSNHVGTVLLEDRRSMPTIRREIAVSHQGASHTIHESRSGAKARSEQYRVFVLPHEVTEGIRRRAGELHDRVTIDVSWAVPEFNPVKTDAGQVQYQVPNERGVFWSFFPTKYSTTLSGALNAAWKTNEDRQNLLDSSELNSELLRVAAKLVVKSLPDLVVEEDPGAYLPLLPGRTKESPNWACQYLTAQIWKLAATSPSLPDQDGRLRKPAELRIHPERLTKTSLNLWHEYAGRPRDWVHHTVDGNPIRRGKMNHIIEEAQKQSESVHDWLEALVEDGTAEASAAAIRVLTNLLENELSPVDPIREALAVEARKAKIVLTESHGLVAPAAGRVFRRTVEDGLRDDLVYVDSKISGDHGMLHHLDRLGIRDADSQGRFQSVLDQGFVGYTKDSWIRFWELLRSAGGASQTNAIRSRVQAVPSTLKVKTVAGDFRRMADCLLPGPVVPHDGSRDAELTADLRFHTDDMSVLRDFGMTDRPTIGHRPENEDWFREYHQAAYDSYCNELDVKANRVQLNTVKLEGSPTVGPLHLFQRLSDEGKAAFLASMPEDGLVENWTRQVGRNARTRVAVPSPVRWLLRSYGMVKTSKGLMTVRQAVGPQLSAYSDVLPVAEISPGKARRLGMPTGPGEVRPARWSELLQLAKASTDDEFVGSAYALLIRVALDLVSSETDVRCRVGDRWEHRPDTDIAVAINREQYDELIRENHPALLVASSADSEQAEYMVREWGMRRVTDVIEKTVRAVSSGLSLLLTDEYPPLRQRFGPRAAGLLLQRCTELEEVIRTPHGTRTIPLRSARQDGTVLVTDTVSFEETLTLVDRELGWGLGEDGCRRLIEVHRQQQTDQAVRLRLESIRRSESVVDKISLLIPEDDLRKGLPAGLLDSEIVEAGQEPDARRLAEMAYNAHDDGVLRAHAKDIAAQLATAPSQFDGGPTALRFVTDLGFPDTFAGARIPPLKMRVEINGPTEFPALHDYQERIATRLVDLLRHDMPQRAMLSLPTGAGKTRVAAEGVIRWIREAGAPLGPILWIAQTSELCEQAVQSWKFVWERVGPKLPLVIDRLWHTNSATPVTGRTHLVVATDAKLRSVLDAEQYSWLRQPSLVLVDEAHGAISATYTNLLAQLGLTHRETSRHLVGLTATPYRSNADLTQRLVQRFGDSRLDEGIFVGEPITNLQDLGVLSRVEHRELIGADMQLNADELAHVAEFNGFLPRAAEQRLAEDEGRNAVLLDEIVSLPPDWPVLVFATSVQHAKFLAAKLGDRGIRSTAIDSATPLAERRQRVDAFRAGEVRVITNYGVLTQGFDAPATRAVVIARPVYSANVYQQMIGRGLRGLRNGGKDSCLILDMRDNITNFHEDLAFNEFEYLWKKEAP